MSNLSMPVSDRDHILGPATAPVTLVEYGDYECPHCGMAYPIVNEIVRQMGPRVRLVFRNFPLNGMHPHAQHAAEAAELAAEKGKFWEMHDLLYENQDKLGDAHLKDYAERLGLDGAWFSRALEQHTTSARIREDFIFGVRSGVNGTPTFFINGVRHDGSWDLETLTEAIERAAGEG